MRTRIWGPENARLTLAPMSLRAPVSHPRDRSWDLLASLAFFIVMANSHMLNLFLQFKIGFMLYILFLLFNLRCFYYVSTLVKTHPRTSGPGWLSLMAEEWWVSRPSLYTDHRLCHQKWLSIIQFCCNYSILKLKPRFTFRSVYQWKWIRDVEKELCVKFILNRYVIKYMVHP